MQIKATVRYHVTLIRMAIIKSLQAISVGKVVDEEVCSCTVGMNAN